MTYRVERYKRTRHWAVYTPQGTLLAVTVYRKGALAVIAALGGVPC